MIALFGNITAKKVRRIAKTSGILLAITVFIGTQTPVAVQALSNAQTKALDRGVFYYNTEVCGGNGDKSTQPMIVIDPGHSGSAVTTMDQSGLKDYDYPNPSKEKPLENEEMMYVSFKVKKALLDAGYRVGMTKGNDLDPDDAKNVNSDVVRQGARESKGLRERADYANGQNADLAISFHDDHSQPFDGWAELYTQKVGLYREGKNGKVFFEEAYKKVAEESQKAGKAFEKQREKAEGRKVVNKDVDFGEGSAETNKTRPGLEGGNIPQVMLYAKVPWVYNEVGAAPLEKHLSQADLDKYVKGSVEAVKEYLPVVQNGSTTLSGNDNQEKAFKYLVSKGLSDMHTAAIVGNLMQESHEKMDPTDVNPDSGAFGIAQWLGARKTNLFEFAAKKGKSKTDLGLQLDFLWYEVNQGSEKPMQAIAALKKTTTIEDAVQVWHDKFERSKPSEANIPQRVKYAKRVLKLYGTGNEGGELTAEDDTTGTATCIGGGDAAVNCDDPTLTTSGLSNVRKNAVCHAKAELEKWKKGEMKRGNDFFKYSDGANHQAWCASFATWIYKQAGYPVTGDSKNWHIAWVGDVVTEGNRGEKFEMKSAKGYTPKPGDMAIYQNGGGNQTPPSSFQSGASYAHISIVTEVKGNAMTIIGGNQNGSNGPTTSAVTQNKLTRNGNGGYDGGANQTVIGFVTPKD